MSTSVVVRRQGTSPPRERRGACRSPSLIMWAPEPRIDSRRSLYEPIIHREITHCNRSTNLMSTRPAHEVYKALPATLHLIRYLCLMATLSLNQTEDPALDAPLHRRISAHSTCISKMSLHCSSKDCPHTVAALGGSCTSIGRSVGESREGMNLEVGRNLSSSSSTSIALSTLVDTPICRVIAC